MLTVKTKFELSDSWLKENALRPPFSQSFEWEEILSREGKEVERLTVVDGEEPVAMALVNITNCRSVGVMLFVRKGRWR